MIEVVDQTNLDVKKKRQEKFLESVKNSFSDNGQMIRFLEKFKIHSPVHYRHSEQVTLIANEVGKKIGLSADDLNLLTKAAMLHDIGKINIPIDILHKDTAFTDAEFGIIKKHVDYGRKIMRACLIDPRIMEIALGHHEFKKNREDRYPRNINEVRTENKLGKILAIIDSVQASTDNERVYNNTISIDNVKKSIRNSLNLEDSDDDILDIIIRVLKDLEI